MDASAVSLALSFRAADFDWCEEHIALLVGLHDIGKADPCFQHREWRDASGNSFSFSEELTRAGYCRTGDALCRHERLSARFIRKVLNSSGLGLDAYTADAISRAVVAHHGLWEEGAREVPEAYAQAQDRLYRMLREVLGVERCPNTRPENLSAFGMRLAGHVVLCDWIASNEDFYTDNRLQEHDDPQNYFEAAREVATRWIERLKLGRSVSSGNAERIVDNPRPIQQVLLESDIPPGLVIIEAPMGEGKTEAAWILAEKWRTCGYHGMYMALPTMATSDSLHARYQHDYLERLGLAQTARLVHGMAWLRDDLEPNRLLRVGEPEDENASLATAWFRPTRRAMLAAHGVGTVDQAMLAGMNVKFGFLRLYGLADRVLVIDEVHAYDAYMSAIICRLLNWCACLKIPVIMLSATLSASQRWAMLEAYGATGGDPGPEAPYPLITIAEPNREARTLRDIEPSHTQTLKIKTHPGLLGDANETAKLAQKLVADGGCCCVILNTVKQAQEVYQALDLLPDSEKLLFHARFTAADRERIANRVLEMFGRDTSNRPNRFVLVATQVVEQSLDVDFDHMISEVAPVDLLLQRSGRMHRHRVRNSEPTLHVLLPEDGSTNFGGTGYVYKRKPLLRTLAILDGVSELHLPRDFRTLIERCYGLEEWNQQAVDWEEIRRADQEWDEFQEDLIAQAGEFLLCEPVSDDFDPVGADEVGDDSDDGNGWRGRTRLGFEDILVIPVSLQQLERLREGNLPSRLVRCLYRRGVKIPSRDWSLIANARNSRPVPGSRKLQGVWLLPVNRENGGWSWSSASNRREPHIRYNSEIGLVTRGGES